MLGRIHNIYFRSNGEAAGDAFSDASNQIMRNVGDRIQARLASTLKLNEERIKDAADHAWASIVARKPDPDHPGQTIPALDPTQMQQQYDYIQSLYPQNKQVKAIIDKAQPVVSAVHTIVGHVEKSNPAMAKRAADQGADVLSGGSGGSLVSAPPATDTDAGQGSPAAGGAPADTTLPFTPPPPGQKAQPIQQVADAAAGAEPSQGGPAAGGTPNTPPTQAAAAAGTSAQPQAGPTPPPSRSTASLMAEGSQTGQDIMKSGVETQQKLQAEQTLAKSNAEIAARYAATQHQYDIELRKVIPGGTKPEETNEVPVSPEGIKALQDNGTTLETIDPNGSGNIIPLDPSKYPDMWYRKSMLGAKTLYTPVVPPVTSKTYDRVGDDGLNHSIEEFRRPPTASNPEGMLVLTKDHGAHLMSMQAPISTSTTTNTNSQTGATETTTTRKPVPVTGGAKAAPAGGGAAPKAAPSVATPTAGFAPYDPKTNPTGINSHLEAMAKDWATTGLAPSDPHLKTQVDNYMTDHDMARPSLPIPPGLRVKVGEQVVARNSAIDIIENLKKDANVFNSLVSTGKIALATNPKTGELLLSRLTDMTPQEKRVAANWQALSEHINLLRGPLGATGFRSADSWEALQAQRGRLMADPAITMAVLDRTEGNLKALNSADKFIIPQANSGAKEFVRDSNGKIVPKP